MSTFQTPALDKVSTKNKLSLGHCKTVQLMSKMIFYTLFGQSFQNEITLELIHGFKRNCGIFVDKG